MLKESWEECAIVYGKSHWMCGQILVRMSEIYHENEDVHNSQLFIN